VGYLGRIGYLRRPGRRSEFVKRWSRTVELIGYVEVGIEQNDEFK